MTLNELKDKLENNEDTYGGYYRLDCLLSEIENPSVSVLDASAALTEIIGFIRGLSCLGYISEQEEKELCREAINACR